MRIELERVTRQAELSEAIGELFRRDGRTYLDVANEAEMSTSTLHDMVSGKSFPRWKKLEAVLAACGVEEASAMSAWREAYLRVQRNRKLIPLPWANDDETDPFAQDRTASGRPVLRFVRAAMVLAARPWRNMRARHNERQRVVMLKQIRRDMRDLIEPAEAYHCLTARFHDVDSKGKAREIDIRDLYEEAAEELVLLAKPGMGKTTQLARLADRLAAEALEDLDRLGGASIRPVPILLNLSDYRGGPLEDWLPAAVNRQYLGVPEELARGWLAQDLLLPLLDGLDQVPSDAGRAECAEQIRRFRARRTGIVVSCRYDDLSIARGVGAARYVQLSTPTKEDVEEYLQKNMDALADVHAALKANPALGTLLRSPLMLDVIYVAYQERSATALHVPEKSDNQRREMIFDAYVRRMVLDNRPLRRSDPPERTVTWLTWLARSLTERRAHIFYLDRLDLEWLRLGSRQVLPRALPPFLRTATGEVLTLLWLTAAVAAGALDTSLSDAFQVTRAMLVTSATQALITQATWIRNPRPRLRGVMPNVPVVMVMWLPLTKVDWLAPGIIAMILTWAWLQLGSLETWYFPVFTPVEQIRWCWTPREAGPSLRGSLPHRGVFTVATTVAMTALLIYLSGVLLPGHRWATAAAGLVLVALYLAGNNFEPSLKEERATPNEGIRRSLRFAIVQGAAHATLVAGCLLAVFRTAGAPLPNALLMAGFPASLFGMARAYRYGGLALVRHWTIRACLAASGDSPFRCKQFLHDAEQRILLRRIGGGYAFPHPLLQEHLAIAPDTLLSRLALHGKEEN
ncbi:helix-turn-helix transcriptional regulator [Microbispora sp. NPDC046973]|uniref:helix-turn-helix transcriptional regulator n=1 Tax=Microbispora sp. NPDC046973 TaxID=3155022 RepID=UPI0033C76C0B